MAAAVVRTSPPSLESMRIEQADVGRMEYLARGGQAVVHQLPDLVLEDADFPLVCKMYRARVLPIPWVGLARLAVVRASQSPKRRAWLDRYFTWPLRVVVRHGDAVGCVMPLLHDKFFHEFRSTVGENRVRPREIQHLFVPRDRNDRVGLPHASRMQRFSLCFETARALDVLHSTGLVYGDISSRNLLYCLKPHPTVIFVEGDALRRSGSSAVVPQIETPDWPAPEGARAQSEVTDRYKLGLMILRILTPGRGTSTNRDPATADGALDAAGRAMMRRALGTGRDRRPAAREWVEYFRSVLTGRSSPAPTTVPRVAGTVSHGGAWVRRNGRWEQEGR